MIRTSDNLYATKMNHAYGIDEYRHEKLSLFRVLKLIQSISNSIDTTIYNKSTSLNVGGKLKNIMAGGHIVLNVKGIDLRFFPGKITSAKVTTNAIEDNLFSHTVILRDVNNTAAQKISFLSNTKFQPETESIYPIHSGSGELKKFDSTKSIEQLWREMTDVHHFYPMLQSKGISKLSALNAVPEDLARQVNVNAIPNLLYELFASNEKLMIFIDNPSMVQIYTGKIDKIILPNQYKGLNKYIIHGKTDEGQKMVCKLSADSIAQVWVVNKFSEGIKIASLEAFDQDGNHVVQFYGERTRGHEQSDIWKRCLDKLG